MVARTLKNSCACYSITLAASCCRPSDIKSRRTYMMSHCQYRAGYQRRCQNRIIINRIYKVQDTYLTYYTHPKPYKLVWVLCYSLRLIIIVLQLSLCNVHCHNSNTQTLAYLLLDCCSNKKTLKRILKQFCQTFFTLARVCQAHGLLKSNL